MFKKRRPLLPHEPLLFPDHARPVTRRDFLRQGLLSGMGVVMGGSVFSLFANPRAAYAAISQDISDLADASGCPLGANTGGKIPFICFDLAGGANVAGSNVLVGRQGGQLSLLDTSGYTKLGLPGDMIPGQVDPNGGDFTDNSLGLLFHSDSAFLRGILERAGTAVGRINGAVIPARSENDTGNNPHNPMYGLYLAGIGGSLVPMIGSQSTESGGNSLAPDELIAAARAIDPAIRPTKVDRPSDVTGLVNTGNLLGILSQSDAVAVMESMARISNAKLGRVDTQITADAVIKDLVRCGYLKAADIADRYGDPAQIDPAADPDIVGPTGIFTQAEFDSDSEFRKTASVMKMVVEGFSGAGTISMGGYDYHTGDRAAGEQRDLRAGRCMGACLEYAARKGVPLMMYVFSDGSVASNGMIDNSVEGRGKCVWTGDNQQTAAAFFLVFDPNGQPVARTQQIGYFRPSGDVETASSPAANNPNLLVQTVLLNYLALHGQQAQFNDLLLTNGVTPGLGNAASQDSLTAFSAIV